MLEIIKDRISKAGDYLYPIYIYKEDNEVELVLQELQGYPLGIKRWVLFTLMDMIDSDKVNEYAQYVPDNNSFSDLSLEDIERERLTLTQAVRSAVFDMDKPTMYILLSITVSRGYDKTVDGVNRMLADAKEGYKKVKQLGYEDGLDLPVRMLKLNDATIKTNLRMRKVVKEIFIKERGEYYGKY